MTFATSASSPSPSKSVPRTNVFLPMPSGYLRAIAAAITFTERLRSRIAADMPETIHGSALCWRAAVTKKMTVSAVAAS